VSNVATRRGAAHFWTRWRRADTRAKSPRVKAAPKEGDAAGKRKGARLAWSMPGAVLLAAPFKFVARILSSEVKLERDGKNLNIRVAPPAPPAPVVDPQAQALAQAAPFVAALKSLLDSHRMTRRVMRHLGYVERTLATQGLKGLNEVPVEVLSESLKQFESLVGNWSDPHLAELRSKMAVTVLHRSKDPFFGATGDRLSNFATESRLLVDDVSHSVFLELERQYQGLVSQEEIDASLALAKAP
jgi:hypothetical protein